MQRVGDAFASNLDLEALLNIVTGAAVEALDCMGGQACSYEGPGRRLAPRATVAKTPAIAALLERAETGALSRPGCTVLSDGELAGLGCQISVGDTIFGTIAVARAGVGFDQEEQDLLAYLCERAGVSAANVMRHELLHQQALSDDLTGLTNLRRLQEVLKAAVERHGSTGAPVALILLDLDNFKSINDTHGHQTGDAVLRAVGRSLLEGCRDADEPARYGGEEFAVVLATSTSRSLRSGPSDCGKRSGRSA